MDRLLVITNRDAGGHPEEPLDDALEVLRGGAEVEVVGTTDVAELEQALAGADGRVVVVAGGDGSMHAVVAALRRADSLAGTTLGLLPVGTGNDLARGVGLPLDPAEAAAVVLAGHTRAMDLVVDDHDGIVVNGLHAGAGAQASRRAARWKDRLHHVRLGRLGYPIGAVLASFEPPFVRLRVEVDGEVVTPEDRHVLMVAVGNAATVGGGTVLTPGADPGDGRIDVMVSLATGPLSRFGYVADLMRRRHLERDDVVRRRGSRVSVTGEPFYCSADGEVSGPQRQRSWRVEPAAYDLLVPEVERSVQGHDLVTSTRGHESVPSPARASSVPGPPSSTSSNREP